MIPGEDYLYDVNGELVKLTYNSYNKERHIWMYTTDKFIHFKEEHEIDKSKLFSKQDNPEYFL